VTGAGLSVIVTNARLKTGDPARPWATALGVRDGMLAVVGSAAEILKMAGTDTTIIDARGKLITLPAKVSLGNDVSVVIGADDEVTLRAGRE
jgi:predicted amidohydrolase YtcJ